MKENSTVSVVIPTHNRKKMLVRLIQSILQSDYPKEKIEIVVVDDFSEDGTFAEVKRLFPDVKVLRNEKELFVSASRNIGVSVSKGDFILFVDDDNVVEEGMIKQLISYMKSHEDVGVCAPLMLYYGTDKILCAGVRRNMTTSKTTYLLNGRILGSEKLPKVIFSDDFPNCFMVRSVIVRKYNVSFDNILFPIHFEESDFCYKIKQLGYEIVCYTETVVWHDVRPSNGGFETELRTRLTARNRILFHRKYSKRWQFLIFILIFNWIFTFYYSNKILFHTKNRIDKKLMVLNSYLAGTRDGLAYAY
jgi:GT2 family glycosyltransferase